MTLQIKIEELYAATKDLMSLDEIKPLAEEFRRWCKEESGCKDSSLGTLLSRYGFYKLFKQIPLVQDKNAVLVPKHNLDGSVKGQELKHYAVLIGGLTTEEWNKINNTSRVIDRLSTEGIEIKPNEFIEVVSKLLESDDPHELAVGLIAATGRRPHEILARGKFTAIDGESYQAKFEGQGKKRGEKPVFTVHTLFPANYLIRRLQVLRKDTQGLIKEVSNEFPNDIAAQNSTIESRRGNSLRRVVQAYFGGKETDKPLLNFRHDKEQNDCKALRAACSVLITARDFRGSLGGQILFASRFLGHITETENPTDKDLHHIATTVGYADYFVTEPVDYPTAPEKAKSTNVKISTEDLEKVKNLQKLWGDCTQAEVINRVLGSATEVLELQKIVIERDNEIIKLNYELNKLKNQEPEKMINAEVDENNYLDVIKTLVAKIEMLESKPLERIASERKAPLPKGIDLETIPSDDLRTRRTPLTADEKINRAFQAITQHNNEVATSNYDRWYIGNASLRDLSGCNGAIVKNWIEKHKTLVDDHNKKFELGQYHNKGKGNITDFISW